MPVFMPCPAAGLWTWAASPARNTPSTRNRSATLWWTRNRDAHAGSDADCAPTPRSRRSASTNARSGTSGTFAPASTVAIIRWFPLGQGGDHRHPVRGHVDGGLVVHAPGVLELDVRQDELRVVRLAAELQPDRGTDGAVRAVRPDDVAGPDLEGRRAGRRFVDAGHDLAVAVDVPGLHAMQPPHRPAEFAQAAQQ